MARKFSGELGECWQEHVNAYNQITREYKLGPLQKLQYLQNSLFKEAQ